MRTNKGLFKLELRRHWKPRHFWASRENHLKLDALHFEMSEYLYVWIKLRAMGIGVKIWAG